MKESIPEVTKSGPQSKNHCTIVEAFVLIPSISRRDVGVGWCVMPRALSGISRWVIFTLLPSRATTGCRTSGLHRRARSGDDSHPVRSVCGRLCGDAGAQSRKGRSLFAGAVTLRRRSGIMQCSVPKHRTVFASHSAAAKHPFVTTESQQFGRFPHLVHEITLRYR